MKFTTRTQEPIPYAKLVVLTDNPSAIYGTIVELEVGDRRFHGSVHAPGMGSNDLRAIANLMDKEDVEKG